MKNQWLFLFAVLICLFSCKQPAEPEDKIVDNSNLVLPENFYGTIVADGLGKNARHLAVNSNGDVYVKMGKAENNDGIKVLRDTDADGVADEFAAFGDFNGTEMAIRDGYLYTSSNTAVYRYQLADDAMLPTDTTPELIVGGFLDQAEHASKTFTFDKAGNIYVNIGAPSNACQQEGRTPGSPGQDPCPQLDRQAGIWKFSAGVGLDQQADGSRYATGIRNAMALDWNDETDGLFAVQHGRDMLSGLWGDQFNDSMNAELPAEEFLQINEGDDFGWPYCYYDPFQNKKVLAPEFGGDGNTKGRCENAKDPILAFPAHLAPNDMIFYTGDMFPPRYKNGAFIAFHGSWNRAPLPQKGFLVAFVPFENGQISGEWEIFADGFAEVEPTPNLGDVKQRPTGLAQGPDGALYVSDSRKGKIYRIAYSE